MKQRLYCSPQGRRHAGNLPGDHGLASGAVNGLAELPASDGMARYRLGQ